MEELLLSCLFCIAYVDGLQDIGKGGLVLAIRAGNYTTTKGHELRIGYVCGSTLVVECKTCNATIVKAFNHKNKLWRARLRYFSREHGDIILNSYGTEG